MAVDASIAIRRLGFGKKIILNTAYTKDEAEQAMVQGDINAYILRPLMDTYKFCTTIRATYKLTQDSYSSVE